MTRQEWEKAHLGADKLRVELEDEVITLEPKVFKSGSMGWHGQHKMKVSGTKVQVNILVTVIGSKPIPVAGPTTVVDLAAQSRFEFGEQNGTALGNVPGAPGTVATVINPQPRKKSSKSS